MRAAPQEQQTPCANPGCPFAVDGGGEGGEGGALLAGPGAGAGGMQGPSGPQDPRIAALKRKREGSPPQPRPPRRARAAARWPVHRLYNFLQRENTTCTFRTAPGQARTGNAQHRYHPLTPRPRAVSPLRPPAPAAHRAPRRRTLR